jgi:UMF1 family MFS transporter
MKPTTAWTFYDWANSSFSLVITSAVFPSYFLKNTDDLIHIGSVTMSNSSLYAYMISAAYLVVAFLSPVLSGFADSANNKKFFLLFFATVGSLSCMGLYFFKGMDTIVYGGAFFILALIGFLGSIVFYNSFLPEITTEEKFDSLSAKGFSMGYFGSVLLLIVNLLMINNPGWFGLGGTQEAVLVSFVMVGLWWFIFTVFPLQSLPGSVRLQFRQEHLSKGFKILKDVYHKLKNRTEVRQYLWAFFAFNAGVQTVMMLAATFAEKQMNFSTPELIILILLIQIVAIGGSFIFSELSKRKGNKYSLLTMLYVWVIICAVAYIVQTKVQFYALATIVGVVMGGIQSLARSTYSKLIYKYEGEHTSFFSFYDVLEKMSVIIGTFLFGFIEQVSGDMRKSIFMLMLFFIAGIVLLIRTKLNLKATLN